MYYRRPIFQLNKPLFVSMKVDTVEKVTWNLFFYIAEPEFIIFSQKYSKSSRNKYQIEHLSSKCPNIWCKIASYLRLENIILFVWDFDPYIFRF